MCAPRNRELGRIWRCHIRCTRTRVREGPPNGAQGASYFKLGKEELYNTETHPCNRYFPACLRRSCTRKLRGLRPDALLAEPQLLRGVAVSASQPQQQRHLPLRRPLRGPVPRSGSDDMVPDCPATVFFVFLPCAHALLTGSGTTRGTRADGGDASVRPPVSDASRIYLWHISRRAVPGLSCWSSASGATASSSFPAGAVLPVQHALEYATLLSSSSSATAAPPTACPATGTVCRQRQPARARRSHPELIQ